MFISIIIPLIMVIGGFYLAYSMIDNSMPLTILGVLIAWVGLKIMDFGDGGSSGGGSDDFDGFGD